MSDTEPARGVARRLVRQHIAARGEGAIVRSPFIGAEVTVSDSVARRTPGFEAPSRIGTPIPTIRELGGVIKNLF